MLGVLVILLFSWILLYIITKNDIRILGFSPILQRLKQLSIGFIVTTILCFGVQYLETSLNANSWELNENFSAIKCARYFWWDFKSVITEELIFRGALLYLLIVKLGANKGILISAISFGIYHWFSFGILGQFMPMTVVFIGTALMGYAWALAFSKTSSIALATGLHLGWNFTINTIFSKGPIGDGVLVSSISDTDSEWFALFGLWLVPFIILLFVKYIVPLEMSISKSEN